MEDSLTARHLSREPRDGASRAPQPCCIQCGASATRWSQAAHAFVCAECAPRVARALDLWRTRVQWLLARQVEPWLDAVPDEALDILLFALLDNGVQDAFGVQERVVNLEEAAALLAARNGRERRALLPALLGHRLTDSLWIWQALAPYLDLARDIPAPDVARSVGGSVQRAEELCRRTD